MKGRKIPAGEKGRRGLFLPEAADELNGFIAVRTQGEAESAGILLQAHLADIGKPQGG